jgi:hypothetical protein
MKTTLDLPDDLVHRIKIRAVQERKSLKRFVADLLIKGLESPSTTASFGTEPLPEGIMLNERGFPVIRCGPNAPASRMTVEELLALEQQSLVEEDLQRAGLAH